MNHKVPDRVLNKLKELPDKPGVYFMRDKNGKVIYVGKAKSLRSRVRSYFQPSTLRTADGKTRSLIRSIHDFDFMTVASDADAVLTEGKLIKEYRPYYNAYFKDDKRFLMLKVNLNDPLPRFETARIRKADGAEYFGPYAAAGAAADCAGVYRETVWVATMPAPGSWMRITTNIVTMIFCVFVRRPAWEKYRRRIIGRGWRRLVRFCAVSDLLICASCLRLWMRRQIVWILSARQSFGIRYNCCRRRLSNEFRERKRCS